jgi:hypothetical protein
VISVVAFVGYINDPVTIGDGTLFRLAGAALGGVAGLSIGILRLWSVNRRTSALRERQNFYSFGLLVFVVGVVLGYAVGNRLLQQRLALFKDFAQKYPFTWSNASDLAGMNPRGAIITISDGSVSPLFLALPHELQPKTADEVGAVASFKCGVNVVGDYVTEASQQHIGSARQYECRLALIDRKSGALIGLKTFTGGFPPRHITMRKDSSGVLLDNPNVTGNRPYAEMVTYLARFSEK